MYKQNRSQCRPFIFTLWFILCVHIKRKKSENRSPSRLIFTEIAKRQLFYDGFNPESKESFLHRKSFVMQSKSLIARSLIYALLVSDLIRIAIMTSVCTILFFFFVENKSCLLWTTANLKLNHKARYANIKRVRVCTARRHGLHFTW